MNRIMLSAAALALASLAVAVPAAAAERRFTVTQFDRIQVDGPFAVTVTTGRATGALATGDARAIDRVSIEVQGRVLKVRPNRSAWGGYPGEGAGAVAIAVSTHELRGVAVNGSGTVAIDKARAMRFDLSVSGSGVVELPNLEADRLVLGLLGSGRITLGGKAKTVRATIQGTGDLAAAELIAEDAELNADSSGKIALGVKRAVKVTATGAGDVEIAGSPACTVKALGSGRVSCGAD
ncbi:MAG TPA: head GIN domain-containing protein [Allosphingosinicella sp.]|jgi:hypothetical protein